MQVSKGEDFKLYPTVNSDNSEIFNTVNSTEMVKRYWYFRYYKENCAMRSLPLEFYNQMFIYFWFLTVSCLSIQEIVPVNITEKVPSWLTPCCRGLLEKLTGSQLVKEFPAYYVKQRFITAFTIDRHLTLSWARAFQSMSPSNFLKILFNIVLPLTPRSSKLFLYLMYVHQKPRRHLLFLPYVPHVQPISFFLIWSSE